MNEEKFKIAIIRFYEQNICHDEYEDMERIIENISDWSFVDKDELLLLIDWCNRQRGADKYRVIQHYEATKPLPMLFSEIKKAAQQEKEERRKASELAAKKRKEKELKKIAKTEAQEKALLEQLAKKYKK